MNATQMDESHALALQMNELRVIVEQFESQQEKYKNLRADPNVSSPALRNALELRNGLRAARDRVIIELANKLAVVELAAVANLGHPQVSRMLKGAKYPPPRRRPGPAAGKANTSENYVE